MFVLVPSQPEEADAVRHEALLSEQLLLSEHALRSEHTLLPEDARRLEDALAKTTHLGIGAHPDDLEILAIEGILRGWSDPECSFTGITVTDGAGSARVGEFAELSDEQMKLVRRREQADAARLGRYGVQLMLDYSSEHVRARASPQLEQQLASLVERTQPEVLYTHNPFDLHDTHVAVSLCVIRALRLLPPPLRPKLVIGCEVWRDLDWLPGQYKMVMDVSDQTELQSRLIAVHRSQVAGGKRYDLASLGRRRAHATFSDSHRVDQAAGLVYGMDLRSLVKAKPEHVPERIKQVLAAFETDVLQRIGRLGAAGRGTI